MSKEYIGAVVILLAELLPIFGVVISTDKLTSIIQSVIILIAGGVVMISRYSKGDINIAGGKIK